MTTQEKLDMCATLDTELRQFLNNWLSSEDVVKTSEEAASQVLMAVLVTTLAGVAEHLGVGERQLLKNIAEAFSVAAVIASRTAKVH
jgi:hypothetical protein